MTRPLFSIVIPTRNRGAELLSTLKTCLNQDFGSPLSGQYEIIVSDNCSTDDIQSVVKQFPQGTIRYERTNEYVSMCESWEFALTLARGRYVGVLCTDDGYLPNALSSLARIVSETNTKCITFQHALYLWPNFYDETRRGMLYVPKHVFQAGIKETNELLTSAFDTMNYSKLPCLLNCFCDAQIFEQIRKRDGKVFRSFCPDVYSGFLIARTIPEVFVTNQLLGMAGSSGGSNGAAFSKNPLSKESQEFLKMHRGEALFSNKLLLDYPFVSMYILDSAVKALDITGDTSPISRVDFAAYIMSCFVEAISITDTERKQVALKAIDEFVKRQEPGLKARMKRKILDQKVKRVIRNHVGLAGVRFLQRTAHLFGITSGKLDSRQFTPAETCAETIYDASLFVHKYLHSN